MFADWATFVSENLIALAMFERFMFCMHHIGVKVIVFSATFNNISWRSVLLVEEPGVYVENHRPIVSQWQTLSVNAVSHERDSNSQPSYDRHRLHR